MDLKELSYREIKSDVRHPWEYARVKVVTHLMRTVPHITRESALILDVGCGDTFVAEQLASHYKKSSFLCVDPAFTADDLIYYSTRLKNHNIDVYAGLDDALESTEQPVSLILLLDVIEHIENDIDFLRDLVKRPGITADTHIIITVPAFQSLFSSHDVFLDHYRRYNNKMLSQHLQKAGLEVCKIGYFFPVCCHYVLCRFCKNECLKKPVNQQPVW